ncbi:hypothetical protein PGT21_005091 [Puccinia graminis f. sp. tritici]|uniref:Uncharacterized protein n=2 Tax=Puccinia graminis f. sp. tritici TaxID=56615 RepID=H6QSF1_PUCGT|nr:uncharacterized protein PGTG_21767 [Puccinia graminis f. sp. tritici CRL 75-36-700-3]EHS63681.1 hypothetical protein PGTG_21767 [Puccinia graminis f. sp. tritici CRL 75-36-700-3]KAA1064489.1 hypothetical protein PGT21_005091 [Puccinia graminis f. sp. tritici]KAA1128445.1 hypothetical protein PGTUg99_004536 [Puccinia graminis f. sp. tritici]
MLGHGIRGLTTRETEANLGRTVRWNSAVRLRQQGEEKLEKSDVSFLTFGFQTKMLGHGIRGLTTRETEANLKENQDEK